MTYQITKLNYENNTRFINESKYLTYEKPFLNIIIVKPLKVQGVRKVKNITLNLEMNFKYIGRNDTEEQTEWLEDPQQLPILQYAIYYCSISDPENTFIMNYNEYLPNIVSEESSKIILSGFITPKSQLIQSTRLARLLNAGDSIVMSIYTPEELTENQRVQISRALGTVNYSIKYK